MEDLVEGQGLTGEKQTEFVLRFWRFVKKGEPDECWNWKGYTISSGYGSICIANWPHLAHRLSFLIHHKKINPDLVVMHSCDNKLCVNPNHLIQGTQAQNIRDAVSKGMMPLGESNGGHKLRESDVKWIRHQKEHGWTSGQLSRVFGVTVTTISNIIYKKTWKHI